MTKKTSIHISTANVGAELHNRRTKKLDYVRADLSGQNKIWEAQNFVSVAQSIEQAKTTIKEKSGRSMQKNATPIKEGVAVISDTTTMEQLQSFCSRCQEKWGLKALAIYTHLDEGHEIKGVWHGNKHAHIIWQCYSDETGKSIRLLKADLSEMQTILAECLQMKRGKSSDRKHLTALQYKNQAEEKRLQKIKKDIKNLEIAKSIKEMLVNGTYFVREGIYHLMGISRQDKALEAKESEIKELKQEHRNQLWTLAHETYRAIKGYDKLDLSATELINEAESLRENNKKLTFENSEIREELSKYQSQEKQQENRVQQQRHWSR